MNYCDDLLEKAVTHGEKRLAVEVDTGREVSFETMLTGVRAVAAHLVGRNIGPGCSVVIHLYNSIDAAMVHLAVQWVGARSCFVDALVQPMSLAFYTEITECQLIVTHIEPDLLHRKSTVTADVLPASGIAHIAEGSTQGAPAEPYAFEPNDVSYIYFTSGTTSQPKGVMLTGENHQNFTQICDAYWQPVTDASKHLCFVPFSHGFGTIFLLPLAIRTASELFIMRAFHPLKVVNTIEAYDITHIYGVPSHYMQLLRYPDPTRALRKLKMAFCAAAKLDHELMLAFEDASGVNLSEGYGLIETCAGIVWRVGIPSFGTGHMGPCPDPNLIDICILNEDLKPVPIGETGQIAVRGKSVMTGYLGRPQETAAVMHDGWFLTGDKGHITLDNHLFMTGRIKDIINIAGIKISPYEVEAVLLDHPEVAEVAVVAAPDSLYGEVVKAYVRPEKNANPSKRRLIQFASSRLISFQVPKQIEFIDKFPLNNMGKLDRKRLRAENIV